MSKPPILTPEEKETLKRLKQDRITELAGLLESPVVLQTDARILRERISWAVKKVPGPVAAYLTEALKRYAEAVKPYCQCVEKVYVELEKKYACLDCGTRHRKLEGNDLKVVK